MKKKWPLIIILLVLTIFAKGQTWEQVGGGLILPDSTYDPTVYALCIYQGKLYAGGDFTMAGSKKVNYIACWDGKKWDTVGSGTNEAVKALCVYKGHLYAGGDFTIAGGKHASKIAKWDGEKWMPLGSGVAWGDAFSVVDHGGCVRGLCIYHNELYACGDFTYAGHNPANGIATWDSLHWSVVGKPLKEDKSFYNPEGAGISMWGYKLVVYNDKLYVGGMISSAGDLKVNLARWNGQIWDSIPGLIHDPNVIPPLFPLGVYRGRLLICGGSGGGNVYQFLRREKYRGLVTWNDTTWSDIGSDMMGQSEGEPGTMCVEGNNLYVGGTFSKIGGQANGIGCWNGTNWQSLGDGLSDGTLHFDAQMTFRVSSVIVYNGYLYAGGYFNSSGAKQIFHIARWRITKNGN